MCHIVEHLEGLRFSAFLEHYIGHSPKKFFSTKFALFIGVASITGGVRITQFEADNKLLCFLDHHLLQLAQLVWKLDYFRHFR